MAQNFSRQQARFAPSVFSNPNQILQANKDHHLPVFIYVPNLQVGGLEEEAQKRLEVQKYGNGSMILDKDLSVEFKLKDLGSSRVMSTLMSYFSNTVILWITPEGDKSVMLCLFIYHK